MGCQKPVDRGTPDAELFSDSVEGQTGCPKLACAIAGENGFRLPATARLVTGGFHAGSDPFADHSAVELGHGRENVKEQLTNRATRGSASRSMNAPSSKGATQLGRTPGAPNGSPSSKKQAGVLQKTEIRLRKHLCTQDLNLQTALELGHKELVPGGR